MTEFAERIAYYDQVYEDHADAGWDRAPGKEVILAALNHAVQNRMITSQAKLIDIGCGSGFLLNRVFNEISKTIELYGVDFSPKAISKGESLYPQIEFRCESGSQTSFESEAFSVLISYGSMEHFPEPDRGVLEAGRILRPGGLFFIMVPTLGVYRTDRQDEGWYPDLTGQLQWNWSRETWVECFDQAGLILQPVEYSSQFGALKPGVFYFGRKNPTA
jgi:SAM-dependent methyltransferase